MSRRDLQNQRKRWVKRAEERFGMREGVYRYEDSGAARWVKLAVEFYPREHWLITDVCLSPVPEEVEGTTRPLPEEMKTKLKNFLED